MTSIDFSSRLAQLLITDQTLCLNNGYMNGFLMYSFLSITQNQAPLMCAVRDD